MTDAAARTGVDHSISVVIPVYQGERHLAGLLEEIDPWTTASTSPAGRPFRVTEVVLVYDHGPDDSARVIRELHDKYDYVRPVWLSRNFGQHAATLAGMASSGGDWIVTMDEDGQHDPAFLGAMLDVAIGRGCSLVYASPTNEPPHSRFRNATSRISKRLVNALSGGADASLFHSYRFMLGEVGRSVAAYSGTGVYLDVALGWVAGRPVGAPVTMRDEGERQSGYSMRSLLSHFRRLVLTGGTRALRLVSGLGLISALLGVLVAIYLIINRLTNAALIEGWTSIIVVVLLATGAILFSLGVIAEYVGVAVNMAMGKPLYLIVSDPADGPLGRLHDVE